MKFGYLRALMTAYMVIWMLHAVMNKPDVTHDIFTMLVGWVVWQMAGRVDERMDLVAVRFGEWIAPYLPSSKPVDKKRK